MSLTLQEDGVPHGVDARDKSDDGSSDSDTTLVENVPEPVGLPRYGEPPAHGVFARITIIAVPSQFSSKFNPKNVAPTVCRLGH